MSIHIGSLYDLQELRLLLGAFDNSTIGFPLCVWWSNSRECWVAEDRSEVKNKRWCRKDGQLTDFDGR